MIVTIDKLTTIEDFHQTASLLPIYRTHTYCFLSKGIEYRIAFLSFDIRAMKEEIRLLESLGAMENTVTLSEFDLQEKIPPTAIFEPINYIVYPIQKGPLKNPEEHPAFLKKLKDLDIDILPHRIYMNRGLKIAFPERFLYKLYKLKQ